MRIQSDATKKFFLRLCTALCACLLCAGFAGPVPARAAEEPASTPVMITRRPSQSVAPSPTPSPTEAPTVLVQVYYMTDKGSILAKAEMMLAASGVVEADPDVLPDGYELAGDTACYVQVENGKVSPAPVRFVIRKKATPSPVPTDTPAPEYQGIHAGDYITFGHYPQTADGTDYSPIEWLVLDVQGNKALLLSRYGLDMKPYHTEMTDITWQKCSLRSWLNSEFLQTAFWEEELKAILTTSVDNSKTQGYSEHYRSDGINTQDKVFLLSYAEANEYLGVDNYVIYRGSSYLKSRAAPTAYAVINGAFTSASFQTAEGSAAGWWWLRSPGDSKFGAARVGVDGSLYSGTVHLVGGVIRPALWINLKADIF